MRPTVADRYNDGMETAIPAIDLPFACAGLFVEQLAAADFAQLGRALEADARLDALLPRGFVQWEGRDAVSGAFDAFFGGMDRYEVMDATVGQVADRLQLRWRIRVRGGRIGPADHVVEQSCYADAGPTGHLQYLALVCSGFRREHGDG